jgi:hypothetical protein
MFNDDKENAFTTIIAIGLCCLLVIIFSIMDLVPYLFFRWIFG